MKDMQLTLVSGSSELNGGLEVYRSKLGTLVLTYPLAVTLPQYVEKDASRLFQHDWYQCARNKTFSFEYVFYTTVFTYHILKHPALKAYDYYMKLDTDIIFNTYAPNSLFAEMSTRHCVFGHSNIVYAFANCQAGTNAALQTFAQQRQITPMSSAYAWCWNEELYFHSNFVVGWLGYLLSAENLQFMEYLYHHHTGYFQHRWTDQAVWPKSLCLFFNISNVEQDKQICDFSHWRHKIFKHV